MDRLASAKRDLFTQFARVGRAVGAPARIELLDLLAQGEKTVETLARQAGLSVTNASNHLKELRTAGLVASRKEGAFVRYRLADPSVHDFLRSLQELTRRRVAEARQIVRDYFEAHDQLEALSPDQLAERLRASDVVLLDVRPEEEFAAGHIPGAVSMPIEVLERRLGEIPEEKDVVAYCRGPYCVYAVRAVELLHSRGRRARRLEEGVPGWRARGFEVATDAVK